MEQLQLLFGLEDFLLIRQKKHYKEDKTSSSRA